MQAVHEAPSHLLVLRFYLLKFQAVPPLSLLSLPPLLGHYCLMLSPQRLKLSFVLLLPPHSCTVTFREQCSRSNTRSINNK